ncbi:MAG: hypothetical protein AUG51_01980 [Acidobacteria bacterium 13_1_20CM_3_53_8]|nr:MAG: hypothetical protein AUG51_01980 [Acidobacteria bacterium 13_1_20CM_3_53_8]
MEERIETSATSKSDAAVTAKPGALGLDIGTSRIVAANSTYDQETRSQLNAFISMPASEMAENVLKQRNIVYEKNCENLYVYGNDTDFFASFLDTDMRRPMQYGLLNSKEQMSQHIIQLIVKRLVPQSRKADVLCFSVPGRGETVEGNLVYHEAVLKSFLQSLGYQAKPLNEGMAVVYSELKNENFTGIGISCGGGMCNVAVSFMAMPVITFSVPRGGDYIDTNVAAVLNETPSRVRLFKEEKLDLGRPGDDDLSRALNIYYDDVLQTLIDKLRMEFRAQSQLPRIDRPMPVVVAGGSSMPDGFLKKFEGMLHAGGEFPIQLADVRMAKDPLTATARGCYIAAMSEIK